MNIKSALAYFILATIVGFGCTLIAFGQAKPQTLGDKVLYRLWNGKDHTYTSDCNGRNEAVRIHGYRYEGIQAYLSSKKNEYTTELYQLRNKTTGQHFYTNSKPEADDAEKHGWVNEGIVGYMATSQIPGTTPFYRSYNEKMGDYFFTTTKKEIENNPDWKFQPDSSLKSAIGYLWLNGTQQLAEEIASCKLPEQPCQEDTGFRLGLPGFNDSKCKGNNSNNPPNQTCPSSQCRCYCNQKKKYICAEKRNGNCAEGCDYACKLP